MGKKSKNRGKKKKQSNQASSADTSATTAAADMNNNQPPNGDSQPNTFSDLRQQLDEMRDLRASFSLEQSFHDSVKLISTTNSIRFISTLRFIST